MAEVGILVSYGGVWDENEGQHVGDSLRGLMVSKNIMYQDLLAAVYQLAGFDSSKFDLKCTYEIHVRNQTRVMDVRNDGDVKFYLATQNLLETPLRLSFELKPSGFEVCTANEVCYNSVSGSNEPHNVNAPTSMPVGREEDLGDLQGDGNDHTWVSPEYNVDINSAWDFDFNDMGPPHADDLAGKFSVGDGTAGCKDVSSKTIISPVQYSSINEVEVGQLFRSKKELSMKLNVMAMKKNFEFRVNKSTKDVLYVKCIDNRCQWRLRAVKLKGTESFNISRFVPVHSCSLDVLNHDHRQAKSWVVGEIVKTKFKEAGRQYKPRDIIQDMRQDYGINLSYEKAWRSRENAFSLVRGSPEESYNLLSRYGEALKLANPGTVFYMELEDGCFFKYLFMALGPCIRGFFNCIRPVIAIDGTFLKCKYRGTLIIATCLDGNNQIYPLAFGIVDRETDSSLHWFLEKLKGAIGDVQNLVFVSDRNGSIAKGITSVFPNAFHGLCVQHLRQNLTSKFSNNRTIHHLFYVASRAYRHSDFHDAWGRIMAFNTQVGSYLQEVGLQRWARVHCPMRRYGLMTTNIAECMNGLLKDARELPVAVLLEHIRSLIQRWFWERREEASKVTTTLTKWAEGLVKEKHDQSVTMKVCPIDCYQCHVKDVDTDEVVNLNTRECTCNQFQLDQLPCTHAIASARDRNVNMYSLCSRYYTNECLLAAYAEAIFPPRTGLELPASDESVHQLVLPPQTVSRVGRPKKARIPSTGETRKMLECGRCNKKGHNRLTCTNPIAYTEANVHK